MTPTEREPRDFSILIDVIGLAGLALIALGLWQLSRPSAYIFTGIALVVIAFLAALPPKEQPERPAPLPSRNDY